MMKASLMPFSFHATLWIASSRAAYKDQHHPFLCTQDHLLL